MSQKLTKKEEERWDILSYMSNAEKTDEEFREWQELARKVGAPVPKEEHRYTTHRAMHDMFGKGNK